MDKIAIAITHGHAAKWLQVVTNSIKRWKNEIEADLFIACSWPDHASIKAITETKLGDGVHIHNCQRRLHSHATGLDEILEFIADKDEYTHMFTTETDCVAACDNWLDWFYGFMKDDPSIGMAGFFWDEGNNHFNINPSGTLYRKDMLLKYHQEVRDNNEDMFWHPRGNRAGHEDGMDSQIKDVAGIFSETRGIKDPSKEQEEQIMHGVPQAAWFEPGSYLYYRSLGEYGHVKVPCDHIYVQVNGYKTPDGTYYRGKATPALVHYWGGTRAWDHLKHPVNDHFVKSCSPAWLNREHNVWEATVYEGYRAIVPEIYKELQLEGMGYDK